MPEVDVIMKEKPEEFTEEDSKLKKKLISEGYGKWTKKDFSKFVKASELYGLQEYDNISRFMKSKTPVEVMTYSEQFRKRYEEIPGGKRIWARINKQESEKLKINEYHELLEKILKEFSKKYKDIYTEMEINYKSSKVKKQELFNDEEDKYLLCLLFKYGYGNWNLIRNHILLDPHVKFNLNLKVK